MIAVVWKIWCFCWGVLALVLLLAECGEHLGGYSFDPGDSIGTGPARVTQNDA